MLFSFWFVFALLGAVASVQIGRRTYRRRYARFIWQTFAVIAAIIFMILLFAESYDDVVRFCLSRDDSAMADFVALFAIVTVSICYGIVVKHLAELGEYLNYYPDERRALYKARREKGKDNVRYVVTLGAVERALGRKLDQENSVA